MRAELSLDTSVALFTYPAPILTQFYLEVMVPPYAYGAFS